MYVYMHTYIILKFTKKEIIIISKIYAYFLYRGDLPDMSDKNMTTLQKRKKVISKTTNI